MRRIGWPGGWAGRIATIFSVTALAAVPVVGPMGAAPAAAADTTVLASTFDDGSQGPWVANGGAQLAVVPGACLFISS